MINTLLGDDYVTASEFRKNQKMWLDRACRNPVTLNYREKQLVVVNRDSARRLYALSYYAQQVIEFCQERVTGSGNISRVFPWTQHLDEKELEEFHVDLFTTFMNVQHGDDVLDLEEMLNGWIATAKALADPDVADMLTANQDDAEYTKVK